MLIPVALRAGPLVVMTHAGARAVYVLSPTFLAIVILRNAS